jgi:hypothetical protein
VDDPEALAGWIWYRWMKPRTKKAILTAIKEGRKAKLGIRKVTARMLKQAGVLDPDIKVRRRLIKKPMVLDYYDFEADGLIRVLLREDKTLFPELALYTKPYVDVLESLRQAGFREEERGKWVLRTDKFNIFVYGV